MDITRTVPHRNNLLSALLPEDFALLSKRLELDAEAGRAAIAADR